MGPTHTPTQPGNGIDTGIDTGIACPAIGLPGGQVVHAITMTTPDETTIADLPATRARRLAERGMVTAEYAVGILSAVAFALVLLKVFHDNSVFTAMLHYVTGVIGQLSSQIK